MTARIRLLPFTSGNSANVADQELLRGEARRIEARSCGRLVGRAIVLERRRSRQPLAAGALYPRGSFNCCCPEHRSVVRPDTESPAARRLLAEQVLRVRTAPRYGQPA